MDSRLRPGMNVADALSLAELWERTPAPRSVVTSPPYLDMHDYGNASQIGGPGQGLDAYLGQMTGLFRDCHEISTGDATFWLVVGAVRRNGRLLALPDRLASCAEATGWTLREAITWDKQKALPWTHHGELRDITEHVLLFSKDDAYRFDATDLRSPIPNSVWWRRYPERYSPNGAMPTNLWSIPIPTQGSWSGARMHFCPFPEELTYRMLTLTTEPGDTVLDPLAGVGSVPAMAEAMGRVGYGLELTAAYACQYEKTKQSAKRFLSQFGAEERDRSAFRQTISELRLLKFAKLVGQHLAKTGIGILWVRVKKSRRRPRSDHQVLSGDFELVLVDESVGAQALTAAIEAASRPPLSKFGIDARFVPVGMANAPEGGYWYASGRYWNSPLTKRPSDGDPHVVARFRPDPDAIDDTPYA